MRSPTARTLNYLRDQGAIAQVCEKWIPVRGDWKRGKRVDFFGADIGAVQGQAFILIQSCSGSGHAARITKCKDNPQVAAFLKTGNTFEVWSWARRRSTKMLKDGTRSRAKVMTPRVTQLILDRTGKVTTYNGATIYTANESLPRHTLD